MYRYTDFDRRFLRWRAAQFRDQLERWQRGELTDEQFLPLRLQNGWYVQRYAPMLRVAIPYGEISSAQLRALARVAREFDQPDADLLARAQATQDALQAAQPGLTLAALPLEYGYAHFTTRTNAQFNWIPLARAADVMDLLASVDMHGIQTSGNAIRNISCDPLAGIAPDEILDPRPFAEILRQWSTLHPEFAFLPRKFKIALTGSAHEDRAATGWYDVGLQAVQNAQGEPGFAVRAGGGMGRTPIVGTVVRDFLPHDQLINYLEALLRVYNRYGRRDNKWKARIKILVRAEGQAFIDQVEAEFHAIVTQDGAPHTITAQELARVRALFVAPQTRPAHLPSAIDPASAPYQRWLARNVRAHRDPALAVVTLPFKHAQGGSGHAPGDANAELLDTLADLADTFSAGEARVTLEQNVLLPWVDRADLPALYERAKALGLARPVAGLIPDVVSCPGGDFCSLANARSLPIAAALMTRYANIDEAEDIGPIDLHISGCMNSCGHHHSGHIGILGVDKDGREWYQITLGGSDGSSASGPAAPGKAVGPAFSAAEVPGAVEAILDTYLSLRANAEERFIVTLRRAGHEPFRAAADGARLAPARAPEPETAPA